MPEQPAYPPCAEKVFGNVKARCLFSKKVTGGGIEDEKLFSALKNGYMTEEKFVLECMERDISVSRPIFNTEPYDFIVEANQELLRVQVKKAWKDAKGREMVCLKSSYPRSTKEHVASQNVRVDFIAAISTTGEWYIIPRRVLQHIKSNIAISHKGEYSKYINNFDFQDVQILAR